MSELQQVLEGVWPPVVVAVPIFAVAWRPWSASRVDRVNPHSIGAWGASLAIGFGFAAAFWVLKGAPSVRPVRGEEWLVLFAIAAALFGGLAYGRRRRAWIVAVLLALAAPLAMLWRVAERKWDATEAVAHIGIAGALLAATGLGLAALAARSRGAALPFALTATATSASIVLMAGFSASLGQLAGALAATTACAGITGLWHRGFTLGHGGGFVFALVCGGLLLNGHEFASTPAAAALLVCVAPLAAWVGELAPVRKLPGIVRGGVTILAVVAVLAWPTWVAAGEIAASEY